MDLEIDAVFWKKYSCRITVKLDGIYVSTATISIAISQHHLCFLISMWLSWIEIEISWSCKNYLGINLY